MSIEPFIAHRERMLHYAYKILRHKESAEDAVQDAFERLLKYQPDRPIENTSALAHRVVYTVCLDRIKLRKHRPEEVPIAPWQPSLTEDDPHKQIATALLHKRIYDLVAMLTENQQMTFWGGFDELSYETIARENGLTLGAVKTAIWRARKTLRALCEANGVGN